VPWQVESLEFTLDNIWKNNVSKGRALTKAVFAHSIMDAFSANSPTQCEDKRANNSQLG
jgi:hypothetical protein